MTRPFLMCGAAVCALAGLGCEQPSAPSPAPAGATTTATADPTATVRQVLDWRARRQYARVPELVVPAAGQALVQTLLAADEFLAANNALCKWIAENSGAGLAQTIDQAYFVDELSTYLGGSMDLFARDVQLLDAAQTAGHAEVSFTVGGRLPARIAYLESDGARWRYDPRATLGDGVVAALRDMTAGLREVRYELESGKLSARVIRDDPGVLVEKVRNRLRRGVRMLSEARTSAPASATATTAPSSRPDAGSAAP